MHINTWFYIIILGKTDVEEAVIAMLYLCLKDCKEERAGEINVPEQTASVTFSLERERL